MDENDKIDYKTKEEFIAVVKALTKAGDEIAKTIYDYGVLMSRAGMLSAALADAYIGVVATVEILKKLEDGSLFEEIQAATKDSPTDKTDQLLNNPSISKYLN